MGKLGNHVQNVDTVYLQAESLLWTLQHPSNYNQMSQLVKNMDPGKQTDKSWNKTQNNKILQSKQNDWQQQLTKPEE